MPKTSITPQQQAQAQALRAAGFTVLAISQKLGISLRTLQRHFASHGVKKGAVTNELLAQARADLVNHITADEAIKSAIAELIHDNIAHAKHLRAILVAASEHMKATNLSDVVQVTRAAAAYATAIKATSDAIRSTLPMDRLSKDLPEDIPELVVTVMTDEDIEQVKNTRAEKVTQ